jgi:hypothetical protein
MHTFDSRLAKIADLAAAFARSSWVWSTVIIKKEVSGKSNL